MGTETATLNGTLNGTGLGWAPVGRHVRRLANPLICWLIFDLIIEFANKLAQNSQREERQGEGERREECAEWRVKTEIARSACLVFSSKYTESAS